MEYEHLDRQAKVLARKLAIAKNLIDSGGSPTASHHAETAGLKADVRFLKHRVSSTFVSVLLHAQAQDSFLCLIALATNYRIAIHPIGTFPSKAPLSFPYRYSPRSDRR